MRKGLAAVEAEVKRVKKAVEDIERNQAYFSREDREARREEDRQLVEEYQANRPDRSDRERSTCTCPPWAVNGWDGPDHDCPTHGCGVDL